VLHALDEPRGSDDARPLLARHPQAAVAAETNPEEDGVELLEQPLNRQVLADFDAGLEADAQ